MPNNCVFGLTDSQVQAFIDYGYVRLDHAFSEDIARRCRDELWADIGLSRPQNWLLTIPIEGASWCSITYP